MNKEELAAEIVQRILKNLAGRRGLRQELDVISDESPEIFDLNDKGEYEGDMVDELRDIVREMLP